MNTTKQAKLAKCPHCKSVFDVSEEEMQLALGAVRCGECMKIFNASYNLINTPKNSPEELEEPYEPQHTDIPTLQEHPTKATSPKLSPDKLDDEEDQPIDEIESDDDLLIKTKKITPPIIVGLFIFLASILMAGWLFTSQTASSHYSFTEVRLSPSSNPKKMDVHFQLTNDSKQSLPLPSLTIQLLNLSSQPISSEIISASNLQASFKELKAGSSQALTVSVNRPSTFVQSAHLQEYLEDTKL